MPPSKPSEKFQIPTIKFIGEQDGPYERILKERLIEQFHRSGKIEKAYLARADYKGGAGVVLGLCADKGSASELVEMIGSIFASIFQADMHLDTIFLSDEDEQQLMQVCTPFFTTVERRA